MDNNRLIKKYKPYVLNLILIWSIVLLYRTTNYYINFLRNDTQALILYFAATYTILGLIYQTLTSKITQTKGTIIFNTIKKIIRPSQKISKYQKTTILFVLVKIFFLPIMLNFTLQNYHAVKSQLLNSASISSLTINIFNQQFFPLIISLIFFIDTLYFAFGYTTEAKFLKNKIRSVEPTMMGWAVAIICYPPFNSMFTKYIGWFPDIYINTPNTMFTLALKISVIILLGIYLSATIALGTKCSNLTNRGIVTRGPYSIIRHPAYISKNLSWWIVLIPIFSWPAILSMLTWSFIYHLRTVTEERHLKQDPDYIEYCKKVKYRYIPYIY